ncbi:MAG TPA: asparaginase [Gemmatimonadaceae bacterium]|jgi:L-asparaginase II|nr:asparaginase [Gemmatimonadaceae bacterium]
MQTFDLDIAVTRGTDIESRHRVHAAVVGPDDRLLATARDPELVSFWRSCAKPFQVMPLLASGGVDALHWSADDIALACASHGGEPEHVAVAERMLRSIGLEEGDLACGPHEPLSARGSRLLRESGGRPTRLHNNCSGKHAAMLALAQTQGWSLHGYERLAHPVQQAALDSVARWTGMAPGDLWLASDGCAVVVFGLPLRNMARAYARLAAAATACEDIPMRVVDAMRTNPFLVGGTDRFDTVLMEETEGRVLSKVGAEGVHSLAVLDQGIGAALKVEDGAQRAQYAAVLRLLHELDALPTPLPLRLAEFLHKPVRNTRGEVVGAVGPAA